MNAPSAYRVEQAMSAALSFRERLRSEIGEDDHDALLSALDSETDVIDLLRRVLRSVDESKHFASAVVERIKNLQDRKLRFEAREQAARGLAFAMIDALDLPGRKFVDPEMTATCGATKDKLSINDVTAVPDEFVETATVVTRTPLMDKIAEIVAASDEPPNWVQIVPGSPTITIRMK